MACIYSFDKYLSRTASFFGDSDASVDETKICALMKLPVWWEKGELDILKHMSNLQWLLKHF